MLSFMAFPSSSVTGSNCFWGSPSLAFLKSILVPTKIIGASGIY